MLGRRVYVDRVAEAKCLLQDSKVLRLENDPILFRTATIGWHIDGHTHTRLALRAHQPVEYLASRYVHGTNSTEVASIQSI